MRDLPHIVLLGLPGSGVSRIARYLKNEYDRDVLTSETRHLCSAPCSVALILNLSQPLPPEWAQAWLKRALSHANWVVFAFTELASLEQQMAWQAWLKTQLTLQNLSKLEVVRWQNGAFATNFQQKLLQLPLAETCKNVKGLGLDLKTLEVPVKTVNLAFLLEAFEASQQNLGMQIYRIQGQIQTLEYAHPVCLEGTASGVQVFPAQTATNQLVIKGIGLNEMLLKEWVLASQFSG